jgi:CubicO group peptidase (beta-lactamase class C family)
MGVLLLALLAVSVQPSAPPAHVEVNRGDAAAAVDRLLRERAANGFGGAIIAEKDGRIVLKAGYGWANRERRIPFRTSTIAQVGSLTKQFTATAALDLWREGRIDLNEPLSKYLRGVPPAAGKITIDQLLAHTSGLPQDCGPDFARLTREELVSKCLALAQKPGPFLYSNLGYGAVGALVETIEGRPLEDVLRDRYLKPLRMNRTGYFFSPALADEMASGYVPSGTQPPISDRLSEMDGAFWNLKGNGGMQASADDMYRWYRALSRPSVIHPTVKKMLMSPHARRDANVEYGYGWYLRTGADGAIEQVSHTGSDGVFFAAFVWRPADRLFIYLVTNTGAKNAGELASSVLRLFKESAQQPASQ